MDQVDTIFAVCLTLGALTYAGYMLKTHKPLFLKGRRIAYVACLGVISLFSLRIIKVIPELFPFAKDDPAFSVLNFVMVVGSLLIIGFFRQMGFWGTPKKLKGLVLKDGENPFFAVVPEWKTREILENTAQLKFKDAIDDMKKMGIFG